MKKYEITEQEEQIIFRCFSQSSNTLLKFFFKNLSLRISVRVASNLFTLNMKRKISPDFGRFGSESHPTSQLVIIL